MEISLKIDLIATPGTETSNATAEEAFLNFNQL